MKCFGQNTNAYIDIYIPIVHIKEMQNNKNYTESHYRRIITIK